MSLNLLFSLISFFFLQVPQTGLPEKANHDPKLTRNIYVVLDASGSMFQFQCSGKKRKIQVAKEALITFMTRIPEDYNLGFFVFDGQGSREIYPLGTIDRQKFEDKVKSIQAGGKTPLCNALNEACSRLGRQKEAQLGYGEYYLLVVTDGEADRMEDLPTTVRKINDQGIVIQVIGFCLSQTHSLKTLVHKYREANSPEELVSALDAVLAEAEDFTDLTSFEVIH